MEKVIKPDIEGEMDEFQRTSQDLRRDEKIDISVEELVRSFDGLNEQTLTDDVWPKLENTESNEIEKDDWVSVMKIAKRYKKTNPKKLKKDIEDNEYERPLILKMGERYILIAGNTRLCTAAAMGVNPKVFIGEIGEDITEEVINNIKTDLNEKCWKGYTQKGMKTMFGKRYPNCVKKTKTKETKEQTGASSSGSYEGNAFSPMIKREIHKINNAKLTEEQDIEFKEATDASSSGSYDVPAFGKTTKGGRKNPLKIDGPDSIYKGRAVKDKNFPKWGGPDSVFVKVKDKCKKFPYCNQGNTGALEFIKEDQEIKHAITETSKKFGIPYKEMEKIVLNEITKIFI
jgi:hypothetical protein